ncbi:hypothetical protein, partial [Desulfonatronospira sp. MSAO_Bac3]|uniref:hypothetical protein n=1 Tax=Desulfonatronospira sp. MSAO_Bac3 TaxID=2293857 RepID=UPI00257CDF5F
MSQKTRNLDRINRIDRITFWPGFRPGQNDFSLNPSLNPVNPVKKLFYLLGCGQCPPYEFVLQQLTINY